MAVFTYQALDRGAALVSGTIAADTPHLARELLRARGLSIEKVEVQTAGRSRAGHGAAGVAAGWLRHRGGQRDGARVVSFIRELATLLGVGVPLLEALDSILRQHRGRFRSTLMLMRDRVAAGSSLAEAMREHASTFDELCISITEVGEDAGTLDTALDRLAQFKERARQLKGKASTALIYPAIVLVMAIGISIFLMTFVVPNILEPLVELGRPLPLPTRIVKTASDTLVSWGWLLAVVTVAATAGIGWTVRTVRGKRLFHSLLLKLPLVGELVRKAAIVRIAVVMGALLGGGVVFLRALQVAKRTTANVLIKSALERCEAAVSAGTDIAAALERTAAFPPLVIQVFAVGQQSGRLEEMLSRLASDYDQDVAAASQRLAAILEPMLIVLLAGLVLLIAMSTMLPILEAGDVLQ